MGDITGGSCTLYKRNGNEIRYWSAIEISRRSGLITTGIVGQTEGESQEINAGLFSSFSKEISEELAKLKAAGYTDDFETKMLIVEYNPPLADTEEIIKDIEELLLSTHLGAVDDLLCCADSIHCDVIDVGIAKKTISAYLVKGKFANYSDIREIDDDSEEE